MTIGAVLKDLQQEFPEITVSKIRFLESEELVFPARTSSGYRKYTQADVSRLRYILTLQRDNYLPLKVIKEQLESQSSGGSAVTPLVNAEQFRPLSDTRMTRGQLATEAGIDEDYVGELEKAGLLVSDSYGEFDADSLMIAHTAGQLRVYGIDARHLKSVLQAASRESDIIARAAAPTAKSGKDDAKQKAEEMMREMTAMMVSLHGVLVKRQVNRDIG